MTENFKISSELKELGADKLFELEKTNLYTFPEGYFNDLPGNVMRNIWFQSFTPAMPYSVPLNYFENLPELIIDMLALFNYKFQKQVYQVPENYFDNLAGNILQRIKKQNVNVDEELENISPLLNSIPKTNIYTVPAGYFENTTFDGHKYAKQPAKVVSIAGKTRKWLGYAAAACVAAVIGISGYFYAGQKFSNASTGKTLASINVDKAVSELSDSTINNYLQNDNSDAYTNAENEDVNIQTLLDNTSDEEMENYLLNNPEPANSKGI